jgi:signal transduction histidine kinase
MENLIISILYAVVFINIFLSFLIFIRGARRLFNIFFGLLSFSVALWSFAIIGFYTESFKYLLEWVRFTHIFAMFSALMLCFFASSFPQRISGIFNRILVVLPASFLVIAYYILQSDFIISSGSGLRYGINSGYIFYKIFLTGYFILSFFILYLQYRNSDTLEVKNQLKLISVGAVMASILGSVTNLVLPTFDIFSFTWLGPIFTLILVTTIFIAILRYHLFNIKLIVTELFALLIVVILTIDIFIEPNKFLLIAKLIGLVIILVFIYFLIKSVYREISLREEVQSLVKDLQNTNTKLEVANEKLKELDQMKSEFLSLATHQIRAPLTAIKGYASLILEGDYGVLPEKMKTAVSTIFESCQNLVFIVNDFLDISRIEQGRMKYDKTEFDIIKTCSDILDQLKPNIENAGLKYSFNKEMEKAVVFADIGKIKQIIGNVIDNSIKYTKTGDINLGIKKVDDNVLISVKDTGVGISKDDIPKLFAKFVRAKDASKTNVIGTGLGLYIAKQMLEAQGGKIWVESEGLGKGSTFFIQIPIKIN